MGTEENNGEENPRMKAALIGPSTDQVGILDEAGIK